MSKTDSLRVCFLAGTLGQGGAERQLFYMLRALRGASVDVTLLSLTRGEHWEAPIKELGIDVRYVGFRESRLARCREIVRQVRAIRPSVVHSQHFFTNLYAVAAARASGSREIGSLRSDGFHEVAAHRFPLGHASLRLPRTIVANSAEGQRNAIALGARCHRIHMLPNVIDLERFSPSHRQACSQLSVCFVGRLSAEKRVDVLLHAVYQARHATGEKLTATIVGDGPERGRLEQLASELKLLGNGVTFAGACEDPRVYYRDADLLALTSDFEGTPNVLLEAMASGLPVVATSVGGIPDLVQSGETGLLCEPGNVTAVAANIVRLASDAELRRRVGANAATFIAQNYSCDALAGNLLRVYEAALR